MLNYILVIIGGVIFIAGYYYMRQNKGTGKTMMFYSLFTYAGLTLMILFGARVLDPVFASLGDWAEMTQLGVQAACFVIGAEFLLKPAFEDQADVLEKKKEIPVKGYNNKSKENKKNGSKKKHKKNNNQVRRSYGKGNKTYRRK